MRGDAGLASVPEGLGVGEDLGTLMGSMGGGHQTEEEAPTLLYLTLFYPIVLLCLKRTFARCDDPFNFPLRPALVTGSWGETAGGVTRMAPGQGTCSRRV